MIPLSIRIRLCEILKDETDRRLADSILGTADAGAIVEALTGFCRAHLGSGIADLIYCTFSVGAGFGLVLADGRRVFLKAWSSATSGAELRAVHTVQAALAERGFPAPCVLLPPVPFMAGHAAVMEWLDRGAQADAGQPTLRRAMAVALARLNTLATPFAGLPRVPRHQYPEGAVWGPTHNVLFDFAATARDAEWIDQLAATSARIAREGEGRVVVGHRDWSAKNVRFARDAARNAFVSAVYDWDSIVHAPEPVIVGMAAATFTATWDIPVARVFPAPGDMVAFVADYEHASGRAFTAGEWRTAEAAATYLLAYTARCEHCTAAPFEPDSAQGILRRARGRTGVFAEPDAPE